MPLVYETNAPAYFEYIASTKSREEILEDENLCKYLNNPYLKDDMELALHWQDAKHGGYEEKKEFVEYLVCNGPELSADTILYYREKCMTEDIYLSIYHFEFSNATVVNQIRTEKYGKSLDNCFQYPCNYLGNFSNVIGIVGDSQNSHTLKNLFAEGGEEANNDMIWGSIRRHMTQKIIPDIFLACKMLWNDMHTKINEFNNEMKEAGLKGKIPCGDPVAISRQEMLSTSTKLNVVSQLGDCAKLWHHMRSFNPYNPNQNKKNPPDKSAVVGKKNMNGTSTHSVPTASPKNQMTEASLRKLSASGDKEATDILLQKYQRCQQQMIQNIRQQTS